MKNEQDAQMTALDVLERGAKLAHDDKGLRYIRKLRNQLTAMPMANILTKVPGKSVTDKVRLIGVTRTAYYQWLSGECRPNEEISQRIAQLTGISAAAVRGVLSEHSPKR